jgi:AraC-like DNA-binding protein
MPSIPASDDPPTPGEAARARLAALPEIVRVVFANGERHSTECSVRAVSATLRVVLSVDRGDAAACEVSSGVALFIPAGGLVDPAWPPGVAAEILDLVFEKDRIDVAIVLRDGEASTVALRADVARRGPRTGTFVLQALTELIRRPEDTATPVLLARALLSHVGDLVCRPDSESTRRAAFLQAIRDWVDDNFRSDLSRESVAEVFHITPNHLSHLFSRDLGIGFGAYLTGVRLESAKALLGDYELSIKEIAGHCGFADANYFSRLFRKRTGRSPSDYRIHYHGHGDVVAAEPVAVGPRGAPAGRGQAEVGPVSSSASRMV